MRAVCVCLLAACTAYAQTATFLPQQPVKSVVPWSVAVCSPVQVDVPVGNLYGAMADNGVSPLTYSGAVDALTKAQASSTGAKIVRYAGYVATGLSVLMTTRVVQANSAYQQGAQIGGTFFSALIPLVQKDVPSVAGLLSQLARDTDVLRVPAGGCVVASLVGPTGKAFGADLSKKKQ